mmetsp:Transcript_12588/g.22877  ORF Transcript_12588/g.22877 Transcript_12588/m.22877 type:complete len:450 (-) Transcript_12588:354-1703(-)
MGLLLVGHTVNAIDLVNGVIQVEGGVHHPGFDGLDRGHGLHTPGSSQAVPNERLGGVHLDAVHVGEHFPDGLHLRNITQISAGGVGVDVVDLVTLDAGILDGHLDAGCYTQTVRAWIGHVVGIAGDGTTQILADDVGTTSLGMLQLLQDQNTSPLSHHEPITVLVPWPGGARGVLVVLGQGAAGHEAAQPDRADGALRAPGDHDFGAAIADVVCGRTEGVVGAGAGSGNGVVGAHEALLDSHKGASHVGDGVRDHKGAHGADAPLVQGVDPRLQGAQTAHTGPNEHSDPGFVQLLVGIGVLLLLDSCLTHGLFGSNDGVADGLIILLVGLGWDQALTAEVSELSRELRGELLRVELVDHLDAALALQKRVVVLIHIVSKDGRNAEAGHHDPSPGLASGRSHGHIRLHHGQGLQSRGRWAAQVPQGQGHSPQNEASHGQQRGSTGAGRQT